MDATLRRLTERAFTTSALIGSLVGVGVFACSRDKTHDNESGAVSSASTPSSDSALSRARASDSAKLTNPPGDSTAGSSAAPASAGTATKPAARRHHRAGHVATAPKPKPLKPEGTKCVPVASDSQGRADFSNSPPGVNPCGLGSMNLPGMVPKPTGQH